MAKVLPSQRLFKRFEEKIVLGELGLTEVVRMGAQAMLQYAVEVEMTSFLGRRYYENDREVTANRGRRNGYEKREIMTGEGSIEVKIHQARNLPDGAPLFQSKGLEAYVKRTATLDEMITRMLRCRYEYPRHRKHLPRGA